jgi:hypothetical protein
MTDLDPREALGKARVVNLPTRVESYPGADPDQTLSFLVRQQVLDQRVRELEYEARWMRRVITLLVVLVLANAIYLAWFR